MFVHDISRTTSAKRTTVTKTRGEVKAVESKKEPVRPTIQQQPTRPRNKVETRTEEKRLKNKLKKSGRPSLSDQLKRIGESAGKLTAQLRQRGGMDGSSQVKPILRSPSRDFTVGKLRSRFPSPVEFYIDHVKFSFHHPYQRKVITMIMYYSDMALVSLKRLRREFSFKVHKTLEHFGKDYEANDRTHLITIVFNSESDIKTIRKDVLPNVHRVCKSKR